MEIFEQRLVLDFSLSSNHPRVYATLRQAGRNIAVYPGGLKGKEEIAIPDEAEGAG